MGEQTEASLLTRFECASVHCDQCAPCPFARSLNQACARYYSVLVELSPTLIAFHHPQLTIHLSSRLIGLITRMSYFVFRCATVTSVHQAHYLLPFDTRMLMVYGDSGNAGFQSVDARSVGPFVFLHCFYLYLFTRTPSSLVLPSSSYGV